MAGWHQKLRKTHPSISDIEEQVGLENMRPYYRMASDNVHANSHGSYSRIGLSQSLHDDEMLLAGASSMGLADPGHSTAISLNQVTSNLFLTELYLEIELSLYRLVISNILIKLVHEIWDAFLEAHHELESLAEDN